MPLRLTEALVEDGIVDEGVLVAVGTQRLRMFVRAWATFEQ